MPTTHADTDALRRERDALREAILRHKDCLRPSQRRRHDEDLYASLADARLDEEAARQLRRQQEYYDSPLTVY